MAAPVTVSPRGTPVCTSPLVVTGAVLAHAGPFPDSPFNPCVRFSRTRLTDDLPGTATQPTDTRYLRTARGESPHRNELARRSTRSGCLAASHSLHRG